MTSRRPKRKRRSWHQFPESGPLALLLRNTLSAQAFQCMLMVVSERARPSGHRAVWNESCWMAATGEGFRSAAHPALTEKGGTMMHMMRIGQRGRGVVMTRRAMVTWTKIACGAALTAALLGTGLVQSVAAQDDVTIVLTAGGSTLTVSPGHADAVSAVAEAHASPGHAETIAAAARAVADCEDGALAEGAAALAVAHPDEGAATETWLTATEAKNNKDNDDPVRKVVENKCHQEKEEKKAPPKEEAPAPAPAPEVVPVELPNTGIGMAGAAGLSSLFAAASAAAAFGSVALRGRRETGLLSLLTSARDD